MEIGRCACCQDELGNEPVCEHGLWFRDYDHARQYDELHRPKPRARVRKTTRAVRQVFIIIAALLLAVLLFKGTFTADAFSAPTPKMGN